MLLLRTLEWRAPEPTACAMYLLPTVTLEEARRQLTGRRTRRNRVELFV